MANMKVYDISYWQGTVDFKKVKATNPDGIIIRAGYRGYGNGRLVEDKQLKEFVKGCKENKIHVGFYFFTQAITEAEAVEEAKLTLSLIKREGYRPLFPIYIDVEWANTSHTGRADKLTKEKRTSIIKAFCETIEQAGFYAGVYSGTNFFNTQLVDSQLKDIDHWVADYRGTCGYTGEKGMWQYSSGGSVQGIAGRVDMNHCYKNYPEIIEKAGLNKLAEDNTEIATFASQILKDITDIEKLINQLQDRVSDVIDG